MVKYILDCYPSLPHLNLCLKLLAKRESSLVWGDVIVNQNIIRLAIAYEICNKTEDFWTNNVVVYSSGHETDISKQFQLIFWNNDKRMFSMTSINTSIQLSYLSL